MRPKWFREPALVIQSIAAVLAVLVGFGVPGLSDGIVAGVTALLTAGAAALTALRTRPIAPSVFSGVITTGATLAAAFGLDLAQTQVSLIAAAAMALMAMLTRAQVTPEDDPSDQLAGTGR